MSRAAHADAGISVQLVGVYEVDWDILPFQSEGVKWQDSLILIHA